MNNSQLNKDVDTFLNQLNHPLIEEIQILRKLILSCSDKLSENVKWNAPNYSFNEQDCITLKVLPPKNIQLIFHRGAKKKEQPANHLIEDPNGLLTWKENDRAIVSFKNLSEIEVIKPELQIIINEWIEKSK
jgi:uncharacterized protein YdeI (YjbR/CyaY-like superfamily)